MNDVGQAERIVRFGVFEANFETGELRKNGAKVPLQGQPFQVFAILLEHVVGRAGRTAAEGVARGHVRRF